VEMAQLHELDVNDGVGLRHQGLAEEVRESGMSPYNSFNV